VNPIDAEPAWSGRYLALEKLQAADVVTVRFDVRERQVERDFGWRKYQLEFRGSTLSDIQPRPQNAMLIPLFPPERTRGDHAVIRTVKRFVSYQFSSPRDR